MDGRRERGGMLPLLALNVVSQYYGLPTKPPVTAGLVAANTLVYLRPHFLRHIIPHVNDVWFNAHIILKHRDLKRFFLSPFYHVGESHLVYNMISLLWKGVRLETSMGSAKFASTVAALLVMSQGITLVLAKSLLFFFDYDRPYYYEYSAGFSGVLFAMKVVLNSQSEDYTYLHGLTVPARHAAWVELILIQMFVPGVSFLGHLGGILAGILFLQLKGTSRGPDPLSILMQSLSRMLRWPLGFLRSLYPFGRRRVSGGVVGGDGRRRASSVWRCRACTFDNSSLLSICEMCGTNRRDTELHSHRSPRRFDDLRWEELRRRRIERFG